ncbi:hypothetical protein [Citromicrobium sp. JLT1363]|uniref:hypothetical protein n=1 Tax=Citromicrobium sp. JLT1363 TaxID=517722 RepID=UPI000225DE40|nr:hypothetical protein [Citromicrobium sp. JLT1363]
MEGAVIFGLVLLIGGLFFLWMASRLWKYRDGGSISVAEAAILKVAGEEPEPRTAFDKWLHYFQLVMSLLFGVLLTSFSVYGLLEEAGAI